MQPRWQILNTIAAYDKESRLQEIIKTLLQERGIKTPKAKKEFFHPQDPLKISLKEINISSKQTQKAISRIKVAVQKKELIVIYGDYDADGITATAILWETLHDLGAQVFPFIPHREEHGYGLKEEGIKTIIKERRKPDLIITVDNGIVAFAGAKYCQKQNIDLIICDHHQVKKLSVISNQLSVSKQKKRKTVNCKLKTENFKLKYPTALAIIHTDQLAGAGVTWFLAREICKAFNYQLSAISNKLELAAIGTISDMVPLLGVNRSLITFGLKFLQKTTRAGLKALLTEAQIIPAQLNTYTISFMIGPRLNAMGRLEHALDSLRLLCTKDEQKAIQLAVNLGLTNRQRQELTFTALQHAQEMVLVSQAQTKKLLFISHESYSHGVIGLVAGKLVERFWRPAIVIAQGKKYSKGSVRSIPGFNIIDFLRQSDAEFVDLGGHPLAAGFTIETKKIPYLKEKLEKAAQAQIAEELLHPTLEINCQIDLADVSYELYAILQKFEPFGMGNRRPVFMVDKAKVVDYRLVGRDEKHAKMKIQIPHRHAGLDLASKDDRSRNKFGMTSLSSRTYEAIYFNGSEVCKEIDFNQPVKLAFQIEENEWNGQRSLQLMVKAIKPAN